MTSFNGSLLIPSWGRRSRDRGRSQRFFGTQTFLCCCAPVWVGSGFRCCMAGSAICKASWKSSSYVPSSLGGVRGEGCSETCGEREGGERRGPCVVRSSPRCSISRFLWLCPSMNAPHWSGLWAAMSMRPLGVWGFDSTSSSLDDRAGRWRVGGFTRAYLFLDVGDAP